MSISRLCILLPTPALHLSSPTAGCFSSCQNTVWLYRWQKIEWTSQKCPLAYICTDLLQTKHPVDYASLKQNGETKPMNGAAVSTG